MNTEDIKKEFKEKFSPSTYVLGTGNQVADWWLTKIQEIMASKIKEVEGMKKDEKCFANNPPGMHYECDCPENDSYNQALADVINKLKE